MDGKRAANGQPDDGPPDPKRPKSGEAAPQQQQPAKPALNQAALARAKALLEKQKALQEKLRKLPIAAAAAPPPAAGGNAAAAVGGGRGPLEAAAAANPLAPGGLAAGSIDPALVAAKAARAVEIASKFGVQASLAGVPALAAGGTAPGMPGVRPPPAAVSVGGARPVLAAQLAGSGPRPLRLDASGREVDEAGNVIQAVRVPVATSLINMPRPQPVREPSPPPALRDEDFIDHSMAAPSRPREGLRPRGGAFVAVRGRGGRGARRGALEFVEEGSLQRQAEIARLKAKYGEADFRKHLPPHLRRPPRGPAGPAEPPPPAAAAATAGVDGEVSGANLVPLGVRQDAESEEDKLRRRLPELCDPVPDVEWWDKPLLEGGAYFTAAAAGAAAAGAPDDSQQQQQQQQQQAAECEPRQEEGGQHGDGDGDAAEGDGGGGTGGAAKKRAVAVLAVAPDGREMRLRLGRISRYVEHPVPLEPPDEGPPPAPQPLKLTKRELKKLRTQRRQAREKEKQELIRQGLLEPPKPKVKISNLMRVLGEQAVLDPTAIEQEVRRQVSERQAAHDDRNLARALTPAEKRDKKLRKLFEGSGAAGGATSTLAAVYRVESLAHGQHRFKVDVNAKENQMTGVMLVCPGAFSLVLVEGCPKSLKRYHKLMLRRIDWAAPPALPGGDGDDGGAAAADDEGGGTDGKPPNSCHLVWEGIVGSNAFRDFTKEEVATPEAARKVLADRGVGHYWDAAANFDPDAAPLPSAVWDRQ